MSDTSARARSSAVLLFITGKENTDLKQVLKHSALSPASVTISSHFTRAGIDTLSFLFLFMYFQSSLGFSLTLVWNVSKKTEFACSIFVFRLLVIVFSWMIFSSNGLFL